MDPNDLSRVERALLLHELGRILRLLKGDQGAYDDLTVHDVDWDSESDSWNEDLDYEVYYARHFGERNAGCQ